MRICLDRNARLGRSFEYKTAELLKPMLHGSEFTLSRTDQYHISCWIVKTSVLMNVSGIKRGEPDRFRAIAIVRNLMTEGVPLAQTLIRIFPRDINEEAPATKSTSAERLKAPPTEFFSISSIGYLGWEMAIGPPESILEYQSESSGSPGFTQIWPPEEQAISWPRSSVSTARIEALRAAYLESSRPGTSAPVVRQWGGPGDTD
jgi:hypothetical protein